MKIDRPRHDVHPFDESPFHTKTMGTNYERDEHECPIWHCGATRVRMTIGGETWERVVEFPDAPWSSDPNSEEEK